MYQKIYDVVEKRGRTRTGIILGGEYAGLKYLAEEDCFFYPDKWYNVICMIRKSGIHYYCNLASPSLYDGEAIKNIDYDLDVKVSPTGKTTLLDEDEYQEHSAEMGYSQKLDKAIHHGLDRLMVDIRLQNSPFEHREISALYDKYLRYMDEDKRMK